MDKYDDIIDSRDIIKRIEELEQQGAFLTLEEREELEALQALTGEAEGYSADWRYGAALIRDSYFREYAEQLADDIGAIDRNATWPACHIDWDAAARDLQRDYTSVEFDGVTYWVR